MRPAEERRDEPLPMTASAVRAPEAGRPSLDEGSRVADGEATGRMAPEERAVDGSLGVVEEDPAPEGRAVDGSLGVVEEDPAPEGRAVDASRGAVEAEPEERTVPKGRAVDASRGAVEEDPEERTAPEGRPIDASRGAVEEDARKATKGRPADATVGAVEGEGEDVAGRTAMEEREGADDDIRRGALDEVAAGADACGGPNPEGGSPPSAGPAVTRVPDGRAALPVEALSLKRTGAPGERAGWTLLRLCGAGLVRSWLGAWSGLRESSMSLALTFAGERVNSVSESAAPESEPEPWKREAMKKGVQAKEQ